MNIANKIEETKVLFRINNLRTSFLILRLYSDRNIIVS